MTVDREKVARLLSQIAVIISKGRHENKGNVEMAEEIVSLIQSQKGGSDG